MWHFIQWVHYVALALWVGGIAFVSIAAPAIHDSMVSRSLAGDIVGKILKRLNTVEMFCGLVLFCTSFVAFRFVSEKEQALVILVLLIFMMSSITVFYTFFLTPRLESLKVNIPTLDALSKTNAAKMEFDRLHRLYVKFMSLNLVLGLAILYGSVVIFQ